jgi:fructose-1,6-bisphosphatase
MITQRPLLIFTRQRIKRRAGLLHQDIVGSLVADFHRNLLKGGIFLYPADNKDPKNPQGS